MVNVDRIWLVMKCTGVMSFCQMFIVSHTWESRFHLFSLKEATSISTSHFSSRRFQQTTYSIKQVNPFTDHTFSFTADIGAASLERDGTTVYRAPLNHKHR